MPEAFSKKGTKLVRTVTETRVNEYELRFLRAQERRIATEQGGRAEGRGGKRAGRAYREVTVILAALLYGFVLGAVFILAVRGE
jgi:hypothetical protein